MVKGTGTLALAAVVDLALLLEAGDGLAAELEAVAGLGVALEAVAGLGVALVAEALVEGAGLAIPCALAWAVLVAAGEDDMI